jgi:murein peptide amidase A
VDGEHYSLPRLLLLGAQGGDMPLRLGLFAGIHGDDPAGIYALLRLAGLLETYPDVASGYCLFIYPVCNPTGFEDNTRQSRRGRDLGGEFWKNSAEPEVQLLQAELTVRSFHGIISLQGDLTSDGVYGYTSGTTLSEHLLAPALTAAEQILPRSRRETIRGLQARDGVIQERHPGVLSAPPKVRPRPFEITLHTPRSAPQFLQEQVYLLALSSILGEYRRFIAYARNL